MSSLVFIASCRHRIQPISLASLAKAAHTGDCHCDGAQVGSAGVVVILWTITPFLSGQSVSTFFLIGWVVSSEDFLGRVMSCFVWFSRGTAT